MDNILATETKYNSLQIKGSMLSLMTLELTTIEHNVLKQQLVQLNRQLPELFKNAPVVLTLNQLSSCHRPIEFHVIKNIFKQFNLNVIAIKGGNKMQQESAIKTGLPVFPLLNRKNKRGNQNEKRMTRTEIPINMDTLKHIDAGDIHTGKHSYSNHRGIPPAIPEKTPPLSSLLIDTPVRSGQQIYHPGDIIIMASVSTGAEILAGENIHVYGTLRGRALAGINDNRRACIFCRHFEAELISIGGHFKPITSESNKHWGQSLQISLNKDHFKFKAL